MNGARSTFMRKGYWLTALAAALLLAASSGTALAQTVRIDSVTVSPSTVDEGEEATATVRFTLTAGANAPVLDADEEVTVGFRWSVEDLGDSDASATNVTNASFLGLEGPAGDDSNEPRKRPSTYRRVSRQIPPGRSRQRTASVLEMTSTRKTGSTRFRRRWRRLMAGVLKRHYRHHRGSGGLAQSDDQGRRTPDVHAFHSARCQGSDRRGFRRGGGDAARGPGQIRSRHCARFHGGAGARR